MPDANAGPQPPDGPPGAPGRALPGVAALNAGAVIVAALYLGRELLVPLVLAILLAFVLAPAVKLLQRARLGRPASVLIAVALAFAAIGGIGVIVGGQAANLASQLPSYRATIQQKAKSLAVGSDLLERLATTTQAMLGGGGLGGEAAVAVAPAPAPSFEAPSPLVVVRTVIQPLLSPLASAGIVVIFVVFVLLYREDLRDRLVRLVGRRDLHRTILAMNEAAKRLSRYFLTQLALNAGFGVFIAGGLWFAGLPNPVLWGILAAIMRFVPFIGSFLAVVPPLLLALAVVPGWSMAAVVLALFVGGDMVMGQVIEPLLYGHSTGLSPIAVIFAAAFWAFLWGPIGLLLATPLTVCLVVMGRHVEGLAFMDVMFGSASPLEPAETFYQRALEGNAVELATQARKQVAASSLADYFDRVAMRGLALAQSDLSRDALAFDRLEAIHARIGTLLAGLARAGAPGAAALAPGGTALAEDWQQGGAVLCIPGRGQLDDLAAAMAVQVLQARGFGAQLVSNLALGSKPADEAGFGAARLCCLSVLEDGSSPSSIRYFLRRIQRRMPGAAVVVCLWQAKGDSRILAALRAEGDEENIVLSLGELVALAQAIAARGQPRPALQPPA